VLLEITPELAGWEYISFQVRRMAAGEEFAGDTGGAELALVLLGGSVDVESSRGSWAGVGGRAHVFAGPPHALYLPPHTSYSVRAAGACELAVASAPADQDNEPRLVTPADVTLEIRGGDNATRQINGILPPGFPCQRLVVVEVYTPPGSWSSYPPHKHDVHRVDADGALIEADLEEVYFYKIDRPGGFAYQRVYTDDASPLQRAGLPIDAVMLARDGDAVLVPEGYHPVVSAPGYTTYYLNVLAGSAQSLANVDDPAHTWVKDAYSGRDPRVPIY
jgi:5-deoxy-glucuronate isomerase